MDIIAACFNEHNLNMQAVKKCETVLKKEEKVKNKVQ